MTLLACGRIFCKRVFPPDEENIVLHLVMATNTCLFKKNTWSVNAGHFFRTASCVGGAPASGFIHFIYSVQFQTFLSIHRKTRSGRAAAVFVLYARMIDAHHDEPTCEVGFPCRPGFSALAAATCGGFVTF